MNIAELRESRAKLLENVSVIVHGADEEGRPLSEEEQAQVDAMLGEADAQEAEAETVERKMRLDAAKAGLSKSVGRKVNAHTIPATAKRHATREDRSYMPEIVRSWLLWDSGKASPSAEVYRAADNLGINFSSPQLTLDLRTQSKLSDAAGAYTVPQSFGDSIVEHLKHVCPIREYATVITTENGQSMPWPKNDDTGNSAAIIAEASETTETDTAFGQVTLGSYNYRTMVKLSQELLTDSKFNLEDYLAKMLGQRIGRVQASDFVVGDGTGNPQGIVYAAGSGVANWTTTYQNLLSLFYSVDPVYRSQGVWFMNDTVAAAIRGLVDDNLRPLWNGVHSFEDGQADTLFGRPIVTSNDMPSSGSLAKVIAYGDPSDFIIRDVGSVQLVKSEHRFFEYGLVAIMAYLRSDSRWLGSTRAIKAGVLAS